MNSGIHWITMYILEVNSSLFVQPKTLLRRDPY